MSFQNDSQIYTCKEQKKSYCILFKLRHLFILTKFSFIFLNVYFWKVGKFGHCMERKSPRRFQRPAGAGISLISKAGVVISLEVKIGNNNINASSHLDLFHTHTTLFSYYEGKNFVLKRGKSILLQYFPVDRYIPILSQPMDYISYYILISSYTVYRLKLDCKQDIFAQDLHFLE